MDPPQDRSKLTETILDSLVINITTNLPNLAATEELVSLYSRSIETLYPIVGQNLIRQTIDDVYCADSGVLNDSASHTRLSLVISIALALLSQEDERFRMASEAYFREAVLKGLSSDFFIRPTNKSLQLVLLMCIYVWICPSIMDIWRLMGHASRMCLDIIEVHGSDKTDSADTGILYRTLYTLETQLAIGFGRPRHLPDGTEVPASSPDPSLMSGDELSTLVYNLARIQNRFHRDMITKRRDNPEISLDNLVMPDQSWMGTCVHDIKAWLADWNTRVDSFVYNSQIFHGYGEDEIARSLKLWGLFQQSHALVIAKQAIDSQSQMIITNDEELSFCRQLIEAAGDLFKNRDTHPSFIFPFAWTHTHAIFSSALVLLRHIYNSSNNSGLRIDAEAEQLFQLALNVLSPGGYTRNKGTVGLVSCLQNVYNSCHIMAAA